MIGLDPEDFPGTPEYQEEWEARKRRARIRLYETYEEFDDEQVGRS